MGMMATYDEFVSWLRSELELRGWDQAELARRSSVTTAQISRIISGERRAGAEVCRKIARALQLPIEEVYRKSGLLPSKGIQPAGSEELLFLFKEMGDDDRRRLLALARALHELEKE